MPTQLIVDPCLVVIKQTNWLIHLLVFDPQLHVNRALAVIKISLIRYLSFEASVKSLGIGDVFDHLIAHALSCSLEDDVCAR